MSTRGKQSLFKLIMAVFSAFAVLLVVELGLRAAAREAAGRPAHDRSAVTYYPAEARRHPWSRDHPDPLRIAVVGDSITMGAGNQPYDTYGARLEYLLNLNEGQRPAMVRIWAQGGLSTHAELRYLKEIAAWKPAVLILGICLNDTEDHRRKEELTRWRAMTLPPPPPRWLAPLLRRSRAASWVYQKIGDRKARRGYRRLYRNLYNKDFVGWNLFVKALRTFNEVCRQEDIAFVPVIFPMVSDVDRYPFDWVHEQIGEVLRGEQVAYLDLLPLYRGQSPHRLQAIPFVDAHPNEIAHRMASEVILNFLLAQELIDKGYLPAQASKSPEQMWRMLAGFVHRVGETGAEDAEKLKEGDAPLDP